MIALKVVSVERFIYESIEGDTSEGPHRSDRVCVVMVPEPATQAPDRVQPRLKFWCTPEELHLYPVGAVFSFLRLNPSDEPVEGVAIPIGFGG